MAAGPRCALLPSSLQTPRIDEEGVGVAVETVSFNLLGVLHIHPFVGKDGGPEVSGCWGPFVSPCPVNKGLPPVRLGASGGYSRPSPPAGIL